MKREKIRWISWDYMSLSKSSSGIWALKNKFSVQEVNIFQILVFSAQSGCCLNKRHIIHSLPSPPVVSVYFYICLVGNAAIWRQLQFPGGPSDIEFRHDNQRSSHGFPGIRLTHYPVKTCPLLSILRAEIIRYKGRVWDQATFIFQVRILQDFKNNFQYVVNI